MEKKATTPRGKKLTSEASAISSIRERAAPSAFDLERADRELWIRAIERWRDALKGIVNRAAGMLFFVPAAEVEYRAVAGSDSSTGLVDKVKEQFTFFDKPDTEIDGRSLDLTDSETAAMFKAIRNYRPVVEDLKKKNLGGGFHADEQDEVLERITHWLGLLDRGWEETFAEMQGQGSDQLGL